MIIYIIYRAFFKSCIKIQATIIREDEARQCSLAHLYLKRAAESNELSLSAVMVMPGSLQLSSPVLVIFFTDFCVCFLLWYKFGLAFNIKWLSKEQTFPVFHIFLCHCFLSGKPLVVEKKKKKITRWLLPGCCFGKILSCGIKYCREQLDYVI